MKQNSPTKASVDPAGTGHGEPIDGCPGRARHASRGVLQGSLSVQSHMGQLPEKGDCTGRRSCGEETEGGDTAASVRSRGWDEEHGAQSPTAWAESWLCL